MNKTLTASVIALAASGMLLAGCSSDSGTATTSTTQSTTATAEGTVAPSQKVIVDVRTPAEYSEGHVEGAVNIDIQNPQAWADGIAGLDKNAEIIVYCRSGNRSAAATQELKNAGFTNVTDLGPKENAANTLGLPIV